jgi:hypothetical protein
MLLNYWGVETQPEVILKAMPPQPGSGIAAGQIKTYAQQQGLRAYLIKGTREDVETHLAQKRPLLVGLAKPYMGHRRLLHYELVVGIHPDRQALVTLDPARGRRIYSVEGFLKEWAPGGNLTLVAAPLAAGSEGEMSNHNPFGEGGVR